MREGWWGPPRLRTNESGERRATWLELFYDLVFVVVVAVLARRLAHDPTPVGMVRFVALFVPVWWAWTGVAFFATRFDTDEPGQRLLVAVQMLAAAALAVSAARGLEETSAGFALSYAALRWLLVFQYVRVGRHIPEARPLARWYASGFAMAAAIWMVSAALPPPGRFVLWGIAFAADFATPLTARHLQAQLPPSGMHIPERFGLFTLIVLGESVAGVVRGVAGQSIRPAAAVAGALGLVVPFTMWWAYFDDLSGAAIARIRVAGQVWLYTHLPLVIGLAATGVGVELAVAHDPGTPLGGTERWVLAGAVVLSLIALGVSHLTAHTRATLRGEVKASYRFLAAGVVAAIGIVGGALPPAWLVGLIAATCAAQLAVEVLLGHREPGHDPAG